MMKQFFTFDVDAHAVVIKEGDTISTGKHTLAFAMIPMVHWPEAMVTYDDVDKVLFSADGFGSFGALNGNVNELVADIQEIDTMLESLSNANNRIVDNIMQLSATTEEVTASAQQSASMSDKNRVNTEKAQEVLKQVLEVAEKMDQFLQK